MNCPRCQHPPLVQNGRIHGKPRYKCKDCHYQWTENPTDRGRPLAEKALAVFLYCHGLSMNAITKMLHASPSPLLEWIRAFGGEHAKPPQPEKPDTVVLELDEMWHSLKEKNKRWIWKALGRDTGALIARECGDRDKVPLGKLMGRLEKWNVKVYYADDWQVYASVLPREKWVQTKAETQGIERNKCQMRHGVRRFKRKSIIVSKSVEMVNITITLFPRFRVNGDVFEILKIGQTEPSIIIYTKTLKET